MEFLNTILITIFNYKLTLIELIGSISCFFSVIYAAKNNIITWIFGLVSCLAFCFIFYDAKVYGNFILQIYFILNAIVGYKFWTKNYNIKFLSKKSKILLIFITFGLSLLLYKILLKTNSNLIIFDTLIVVLSIIADWLLTLRKIENWIYWFVVNIISVVLYFKLNLYLLSIEYLIFCFLSVWGYINWLKIIKNENRISSR